MFILFCVLPQVWT